MKNLTTICKMVLCIFLTILLQSCSNEKIMPIVAVSEAAAGCALPSGRIYALGEGTSGRQRDEDVFRLLFDEYETGMAGVRSSSVYIAAREQLCEMAVFLCYGDTEETVDMCQRRGEFLSRNGKGVQYMTAVKGKYVLFAAGEDPDALLSALGRAVDGGP